MADETIPRRTHRVLLDVAAERRRQDVLWPEQARDPRTPWLAILTEEVGEVARAALGNDGEGPADIRSELVQVAAVAVAWVEWLDRREQEK